MPVSGTPPHTAQVKCAFLGSLPQILFIFMLPSSHYTEQPNCRHSKKRTLRHTLCRKGGLYRNFRYVCSVLRSLSFSCKSSYLQAGPCIPSSPNSSLFLPCLCLGISYAVWEDFSWENTLQAYTSIHYRSGTHDRTKHRDHQRPV